MFNGTCRWCGKNYTGGGQKFCSLSCKSSYQNSSKNLPQIDVKKYNTFLKLKGDYCVSADFHIPCHDSDMIAKMLGICKKMKITKIIIAGDFLNNSKWRAILKGKESARTDPCMDYNEILSISGDIIKALLAQFDEIVMLPGNHDDYLIRIMHNQIKQDKIYQMMGLSPKDLSRIKISIHPFCELNNKWHITHPLTYNSVPCATPRKLAIKYRRSVISAHGHHFGMCPDISARDLCIEAVGMFDDTKIDYKWLTDSGHPQWTSGFLIIRGNKPYLFSDLTTDWDFWLNKIKL